MKLKTIFSSLLLLGLNLAYGLPPIAPIRTSDDRLISQGSNRGPKLRSETLIPDSIQNQGSTTGALIQIVRMVKNQAMPVSGLRLNATFTTNRNARQGKVVSEVMTDVYGRIQIPVCDQSTINFSTLFKDSRYDIASGNKIYRLEFNVPCSAKCIILFKEDSPAGQVVSIFQVIQRALYTLAQVSDFKFWDRPIHFQFPSDGDYYINDYVNLTLGHQWDVVGHEMGHAIYDQANIGSFGGGPHKIDECYSAAMALSEGWASFFAAWIHIDLRDNDAKFEYLVPRRAPIRFENVPSDVCGKSTNEWRVTSFFWDLIDLNQDGEVSQVEAKKLWDDLLIARSTSVKSAAERLLSRGWNKDQLLSVWKLNFPAEQR